MSLSHETLVAGCGLAGAVFGFAGALVILYASWQTVRVRKAIAAGNQVGTIDADSQTSVDLLLAALNDQYFKLLDEEHKLSIRGAILLAIGFAFAFVREVLVIT